MWQRVRAQARAGRPRRAGFTIVELMIALVIIAVMAMTIAPSLSEMLANNRQTGAAMDLVRLGRRVRAQSAASGTAQMLRFRGDGDGSSEGLGTITVYAGMNSKCNQTPWAQTFTPAEDSGLGPSEVFDMADYNPTDGSTAPAASDKGRQVITLDVQVAGATPIEYLICYQPNGEVYAGATLAALAPQFQPVTFLISRQVDRVPLGRTREVIFPLGGNARLR